jgi:DNA-binding transcriptional LysR family regulator
MNPIDLHRADLNLLVVFQLLLAERHVGRAAKRLALTQSAVSHALGRLRDLFGDPLFIRHPKGVEPTARALTLAPAIADILARAQSLLVSPAFDPTLPCSFTIATIDLTIPTVIVPLIEHLRRVAPAIDVRVVPLVREHVVAAFDRQEIDLAILNFPDPPKRVASRPVLKDRYVGIARRGHPGLKRKPLTAKAYAALPHLLFSPRGDAKGFIDQPLAQLSGRSRRVVMTVPHVLAVPLIVACTDLVTVLAERIARLYASELDLELFEPPLELPDFTISALTSAARAGDPSLEWLQQQVMHVCGSKPSPALQTSGRAFRRSGARSTGRR